MGFKIGDKVVPHKKSSGWCNLSGSLMWKQAKKKKQPYLYINGLPYMSNGNYILNSTKTKVESGDFFSEDDFTKYGTNLNKEEYPLVFEEDWC